ncbi:hypothetical protein ACFQ9X_40520 [Catenulispora yoronensis]
MDPLTVLAAVIMVLVGTMIGTGHRAPQLGIDLAGGTTMTMTAKGGTPSAADMDTALQIMRNRVNGQGVSEAEVTKQGSKAIQVDVPGKNSSEMLKQLGQTAKLYFRIVVPNPTAYGVAERTTPAPVAATPTSPSSSPSGSATPSGSASPRARPPVRPRRPVRPLRPPAAAPVPRPRPRPPGPPAASTGWPTPV